MLVSVIAVALLAAANGANDLSRPAAMLLALHGCDSRAARYWCACWTLAGSLASGFLAAGVAHRFADRFAVINAVDPTAIAVIAIAAFTWIRLATQRQLPVSTTHAILGSMLAVMWWTQGQLSMSWLQIGHDFLLPLLTSPVIALAAVMTLTKFATILRLGDGYAAMHWLSGGLVGMSRGINDSAKIWALLLPLTAFVQGMDGGIPVIAVLLVAGAMLAGGIVDGRRVAELLAFRVTTLTARDGLIVNVTTAGLITLASIMGLPVASSHVVAGAILGSGLSGSQRSINWRVLWEMALGWILTLPVAAVIALLLEEARVWGGPVVEPILLLGFASALLALSLPVQITAVRPRRRPMAIGAEQVEQRRIVFVCGGNTSRSPIAAAICNAEISRWLGLQDKIVAMSAGLNAQNGAPMTRGAIAALARIGLPALTHAAASLDIAQVRAAEVIFGMTEQQCQEVIARFPQAANKTFRLRADGDVDDPSAGTSEIFQIVAAAIARAVSVRLLQLRSGTGIEPAPWTR